MEKSKAHGKEYRDKNKQLTETSYYESSINWKIRRNKELWITIGKSREAFVASPVHPNPNLQILTKVEREECKSQWGEGQRWLLRPGRW